MAGDTAKVTMLKEVVIKASKLVKEVFDVAYYHSGPIMLLRRFYPDLKRVDEANIVVKIGYNSARDTYGKSDR